MSRRNYSLIIIILLSIIRLSVIGFNYYPFLDDYIQFGIYPNISNAYFKFKLYSYRPLAGFFDIYIIGKLWGNLKFVLYILSILEGISCYILTYVFDNSGFKKTGIAFSAIFLLSPITTEGSYWISASQRLIIPLFLGCISFVFLLKSKKIPFFLFNFISLFFYEQASIFIILLSIILILKLKKYNYLIFPFFSGFFLFFYYLYFSLNNPISNRFEMGINTNFFNQIINSYKFNITNTDILIPSLFLFFAMFVSIIISHFGEKSKYSNERIIIGLIIVFATYFPFIILKNTSVGLRNSFFPMIGLALIFDSLIDLIPFKNELLVLTIFSFLICYSNDILLYKQNYLNDQNIIQEIAQNTDFEKTNTIKNPKLKTVKSFNDHNEHILSITAYDWAITGAIRERTKNYNLPYYILDFKKID